MFEQAQIQEFKEAFTIMDQNRDGFIDKSDLRDTFCALGELRLMLVTPREISLCIIQGVGEVIILGEVVAQGIINKGYAFYGE